MTAEEIIEILKKYEVRVEDFAYDDIQEDLEDTIKVETGEWKEINQYGGEGQGDTWYSIKHFPKHNVYIKVSGYYSSYNGTDFGNWKNSCKGVIPVQKTIIDYEVIK